MKIAPFTGGTFGLIGFCLAVFAGLSANNPVEVILWHGLGWALGCYLVGLVAGMAGTQIAIEHAAALAKRVAASDAAAAAENAQGAGAGEAGALPDAGKQGA